MRIMYLCPWKLRAVDFPASEYPKTEFGYYTMKRGGMDITPYTPRREGWKAILWNSKPHLFGALFTQLGCLKYQKEYDIIYIGFDMHILPLAIAKMLHLCRKPIFVLSHFTYNSSYTNSKWKKWYKIIERWFVFKYIDRISFANDQLLNIATNGGGRKLSRHQRFVANWGATFEFYDKNIYHTQPAENFFMAAGGMNRDYETLIKAFQVFQEANLKVYAKYRDYTEGQKVPANVEFKNLMDGNDYVSAHKLLRDAYYNCIAVLLPIDYINDVPNGATVLVEALAMGKPIIITEAETNYIDVEKEGCGLTVKAHDVQDWVRVLTFIFTHIDERKKMGERSYLLAKEKYNDCNFVKTITNQMVDLVSNKK